MGVKSRSNYALSGALTDRQFNAMFPKCDCVAGAIHQCGDIKGRLYCTQPIGHEGAHKACKPTQHGMYMWLEGGR